MIRVHGDKYQLYRCSHLFHTQFLRLRMAWNSLGQHCVRTNQDTFFDFEVAIIHNDVQIFNIRIGSDVAKFVRIFNRVYLREVSNAVFDFHLRIIDLLFFSEDVYRK